MKTTRADYDLLAVFVAVADHASFSRAARALGIGKGTVSRAIARLEASVGAELIHRTTHTVALSTAGVALYERTAAHVAALDQAVLKLPERASSPSGDLRIAAPPDFGVIVLPEILSQFALRYPDVRLDVRLGNAHVDLVAEGFDLAIRVAPGRLADSTLTARRIGSSDVRFYASPSYVARRGEPRAFGDPAHAWVVFGPALRRLRPPRGFQARIVADDFLLLRDLLRDGAGVGALPAFVAEAYVASGALVTVMPSGRIKAPGGLYLVYPSSGQVPRKVTAFRDFLVERLRARPTLGG